MGTSHSPDMFSQLLSMPTPESLCHDLLPLEPCYTFLILYRKCYIQRSPRYSGNMAERVMVTGKGLQKENALAAPAVKNQQEYARCRECISSGRGPLEMV